MSESTCPRCGFVQEGGEECQRCGVVFRRFRAPLVPSAEARPLPTTVSVAPPAAPEAAPPRAGILRRAYHVFRWVALATTVGALILILRTRPAPEIRTDPDALRRAESKWRAVEQSAALGTPQTLTWDEAELNAWLQRNLALARSGGGQTAEPSVEELRSNVRDLKLQLAGDLLRAWVLFDIHGKDLTLVLEGRLSVKDRRLRLTPTAGFLGSLPLPRKALDGAVARLFDDPQNADKFQLPPDVRDVRVEHGQIVIDWQ